MTRLPRRAGMIVGAVALVMIVRKLGVPASELGGGVHDALGAPVLAPPTGLLDSASSLGLLLLGSWLFGQMMRTLRLPMISGYLIFGMLLGPDMLSIVTRDQLPYLRVINDLAISLIALTAGGEIHFSFLKQRGKAVALMTLMQSGAVLVGVTGVMYLLVRPLGLTQMEPGVGALIVALLLGVVSTASSPAVVVAIIAETGAQGILSQMSLAVTVCKDLALVALFVVVMAVAGVALTGEQGGGMSATLAPLVLRIGGSLAAGAGLGLALAWYVRRVNAHLPVFVVFTCFGIALFSEAMGLETLIVALVAGLLMENLWGEAAEPLFDAIEKLSLPVYCVFFAVAGAKMDLGALLELWPAALLLVAVRGVWTWAGAWAGAKLGGLQGAAGRWIWTSFIAQAGVSIVLVSIIQETFKDFAFADIQFNLVVAAIAIEQLAGPILFKMALSRAGEVGAASTLNAGSQSVR